MKYIKQKIENKIYTYERGKFFPIFEGGELRNKREFVIYKVRATLNV